MRIPIWVLGSVSCAAIVLCLACEGQQRNEHDTAAGGSDAHSAEGGAGHAQEAGAAGSSSGGTSPSQGGSNAGAAGTEFLEGGAGGVQGSGGTVSSFGGAGVTNGEGGAGADGNGGTGGAGTVKRGAVFERGRDTILVTQVVGSRGATLTGPEGSRIAGVSVTFPPNALETDTQIALGFNDGVLRNTVGAWSGVAILLKSAGATEFKEAVSIAVPAQDAEIIAPYFIDDANSLYPMGLAPVDATDGVARFGTFHASIYTATTLPPDTCDRLTAPLDALPQSISTGFKPSKDGFSFANFVDPTDIRAWGGQCIGMTEYAVWHFKHRSVSSKPLSELDDGCQRELLKSGFGTAWWDQMLTSDVVKRNLSDRYQFCGIADALTDTAQPVLLFLSGGGSVLAPAYRHSVLATGYSMATPEQAAACGGDIAVHVYDPNYASRDDLVICYDSKSKSWSPYENNRYDNIRVFGDGQVMLDFSGVSCSSNAAELTPPNPLAAGITWGDPHLRTFDGIAYDLQAVGEFTLFSDPDDGMEVQVRTWGAGSFVAINVGVAARVETDRLAFYAGGRTTLNGVDKTFAGGVTQLPGGGAVIVSGGERIVRWADGSQLRVVVAPAHVDVRAYVANLRKGKLIGLLGKFDSELTNDLLTREGAVIASPVDFETLYNVFAESWRIQHDHSLFDYAAGETTETFTNRAFPTGLLRVQDLEPTLRAEAEAICEAYDIGDPVWFEACVLDVAATGDPSFADGYSDLLAPTETVEVLPPLHEDALNGGALSGSRVAQGTLDPGSKSFFSFAALQGEGVQLRLVDGGTGPFAPWLRVYGPTGTLLANTNSADVAYSSFNANLDGTYTVVVADASGRQDVTADYRLYFAKAPGANEGGELAPSAAIRGTIDKGDLDSFTFKASMGAGVQLRVADVAGGALTPAVVVYGPTGALIGSHFSVDVAYVSFSAPATGTYTVIVHDWTANTAASTGDYQLYFTQAPGANEGGLLDASALVSGTIDKGDLDSFTFTATSGEGLQLRAVDTAGGAFTPAVVVYGPTGALVGSHFSTDVAYVSFSAPATGTYTVIVHDWTANTAASSGDYRLYVAKAPGANEGGELQPSEEVNGTIDKGDLDSFTFSGKANEEVQLRIADLAGAALTPSLLVYGPTGTLVANHFASDVASRSLSLPATGTYTVIVHDWTANTAASGGDYKLYFAKAPGANEGGIILPNQTVMGTIDKGDLDSFTFTATVNQVVQLRLSDLSVGIFTPALAVYRPVGSSAAATFHTDLAALTFTAPASGTYTVIVYDWTAGSAASSGDYSLWFDVR